MDDNDSFPADVDENYQHFLDEVMGPNGDFSENEAEQFHAEALTEGSQSQSETTEDEDGDSGEDYIPVEDSHLRDQMRNAPSASALPRDRKRTRQGEGDDGEAEACSSGRFASQDSEWSRCEIDGLFCPICMEAWSNEGDHHISCLPCGHIYGMSCIKKWLQQQKRNAGKCPQCNHKCTMKDVRKLFASRLVTVDVESQKRIRHLEAACASLERKDSACKKKESEWKRKEAESEKKLQNLQQKIRQLNERTNILESIVGKEPARLAGPGAASWGLQGYTMPGKIGSLKFPSERSSCSFSLQMEAQLEGARLFDVSDLHQMMLVSRRQPGIASRDVLTKMSLINPREVEDIFLPSNTRAVKDMHISPSNGGLVLFASLGKSLAILSLESNNIVLSYELPAVAWSCSWDYQRPNYIYAGLQNGTLMVFDMRQTLKPVDSLNGLSSNPMHTIHAFSQGDTNTPRSIFTASSIGISTWNVDCPEERPSLIPESADDRGVCISLACSLDGYDFVASYRPKIDIRTEMAPTQPSANPSAMLGQVMQGSHVLFKRAEGSCSLRKAGSVHANVSDIRLPRSTIVNSGNQSRIFASGDEATNELALQDLPSFSTSQRFQLSKYPLRDIKYAVAMNRGLLTCLSDDILQVYHS